MNEHQNSAVGDVVYWRLTYAQAARYLARLARMHADTSARFADLAAYYGRRVVVCSRISMVLAGIAAGLAVLAVVTA